MKKEKAEAKKEKADELLSPFIEYFQGWNEGPVKRNVRTVLQKIIDILLENEEAPVSTTTVAELLRKMNGDIQEGSN